MADGTYSDDPCPDANGYVGHFGGAVINNFFSAADDGTFNSQYGVDTGIALWQACNAKVYHNTLAFTSAPFSAVEYRFENTKADIINNLTTHKILQRPPASASLAGNLQHQALTIFTDSTTANLHLDNTATAAIDKSVVLAAGLCDDDIDRGILALILGLAVLNPSLTLMKSMSFLFFTMHSEFLN